MLTFIKLGGSLITDKRVESSFKEAVTAQIAQEIRATLDSDSTMQLLIGHGSGSFGHFAAQRYRTIEGVHTLEEWQGFAEVAVTAAALNRLVSKTFASENLAVWPIQPSASAIAQDGVIKQMSLNSIQQALEHNLIPLVYGDVAIDTVRGGTIISTETIFDYLAKHLPVRRIFLLGDMEGVFDTDGSLIPQITPQNFHQFADALGGSSGVDVTGGMYTKVRDMLSLVSQVPNLTIRIFYGAQSGTLEAALLDRIQPGTLITA